MILTSVMVLSDTIKYVSIHLKDRKMIKNLIGREDRIGG